MRRLTKNNSFIAVIPLNTIYNIIVFLITSWRALVDDGKLITNLLSMTYSFGRKQN